MKYNKLKIIGKGSFGIVYLVENTDKEKFALKSSENTDENNTSFDNEIKLLQLLNHENIISIIDYYKSSQDLNIIMEYAANGNLEQKIKSLKKTYKKFNDSQIKRIATSLTEGINYLHENKIIHRDIKPSNILITKDKNIKITDFGISKLKDINKLANTRVGTPYYMAPEIILGKFYSYQVDYWGLGCILYELILLYKPFDGANFYILSNKIKRGLVYTTTIDYKYRNIVKGLINVNPGIRYGYLKVKDFFKEKIIKLPDIKKPPPIKKIESSTKFVNESTYKSSFKKYQYDNYIKYKYPNMNMNKPRKYRIRDRTMHDLVAFHHNRRRPF